MININYSNYPKWVKFIIQYTIVLLLGWYVVFLLTDGGYLNFYIIHADNINEDLVYLDDGWEYSEEGSSPEGGDTSSSGLNDSELDADQLLSELDSEFSDGGVPYSSDASDSEFSDGGVPYSSDDSVSDLDLNEVGATQSNPESNRAEEESNPTKEKSNLAEGELNPKSNSVQEENKSNKRKYESDSDTEKIRDNKRRKLS